MRAYLIIVAIISIFVTDISCHAGWSSPTPRGSVCNEASSTAACGLDQPPCGGKTTFHSGRSE